MAAKEAPTVLTKELYNKVTRSNVRAIHIHGNTIYINPSDALSASIVAAFGNFESSINIHEFANKCKEWASNKLKLSVQSAKGYNGWYINVNSWNDSTFKSKRFDNIDTEPEAVFKACQWILDNNL